jgi:hypothetical protein
VVHVGSLWHTRRTPRGSAGNDRDGERDPMALGPRAVPALPESGPYPGAPRGAMPACQHPRRRPASLASAHLHDIEADDDTVMNRICALIAVDRAVSLLGVKASGDNVT